MEEGPSERLVRVRYVAKDWVRSIRILPTSPVIQLLSKAVVKCSCGFEKDLNVIQETFGLYIPSKKIWLENSRTVQSYELGNEEVIDLQFKKEPILNRSNHHYAEGWLYKRGLHNTSWKLRWFVLRNFTLFYYKKKSDDTPAGSIELSQVFDFGENESKKRQSNALDFFISLEQRVYSLQAENSNELQHWLRILRNIQNEIDGETIEEESEGSDEEDVNLGVGVGEGEGEKQNAQTAKNNDTIIGDKTGYLLKKGKSTKNYRKRWFVLKDKLLYYYQSHKETTYKAVINLEGCQILNKSKAHKPNRFKIISGSKVYDITAESQEDFEDWIDAFEFISGITIGNQETRERREHSKEPSTDIDEPNEMEGYLMKQGHNVINDWRKRWFMLRGRTLFYSKSRETKGLLLGSIPLAICVVDEADEKTKKSFTFEISLDATRYYFLQASSEEEREEWLTKLRFYSSAS